MLTGWWRSRHTGPGAEPSRGEVPGRAPPGRIGRAGVQEMRLQPGRPNGIQTRGFVHEDPGVGPGDRPGLQGSQGQRQRRGQGLGLADQRPGALFTDGQDTGELGNHHHLLDRTVMRGQRRRRQGPGRRHIVRGQPNLQRREPGLQPRHLREPVQAGIRQIPQRIIDRVRIRPCIPGQIGVPGRISGPQCVGARRIIESCRGTAKLAPKSRGSTNSTQVTSTQMT